MRLIGPWFSGPTRRVGITLKLLGLPFEHLPFHAYLEREQVRDFSPMGKVPALVLDDGRVLHNSWSIIDYVHELVGPSRALLPSFGEMRLDALQHVGTADAIYGKLSNLYDESLRPAETQIPDLVSRWTEQVHAGFRMLEAALRDGWLVGEHLSQADIFAVIVYETASKGLLPDEVHPLRYPRLGKLFERAARVPAISETSPFS